MIEQTEVTKIRYKIQHLQTRDSLGFPAHRWIDGPHVQAAHMPADRNSYHTVSEARAAKNAALVRQRRLAQSRPVPVCEHRVVEVRTTYRVVN